METDQDMQYGNDIEKTRKLTDPTRPGPNRADRAVASALWQVKTSLSLLSGMGAGVATRTDPTRADRAVASALAG